MTMPSKSTWTYCATLVLTLIALCLIPEVFGPMSHFAEASQVAGVKPREEFPRNRFEPKHEGSLVTLQYWFKDKDRGGAERGVSCQIDEQRAAELRSNLGISLCPDNPSPDLVDQPLSACLLGNKIQWHGVPSLFASSDRPVKYPYAKYLLDRGLRCDAGQFVLDYPTLIAKATPLFQDCVINLNRQLVGEPEGNRDLRLLMEFFLAMNAAEVPGVDQKSRKWTAGFLLPTEVIGENTGDCDSKAAAFCAVKRDARRLVIFRSDHLVESTEHGHAFVGLDITSSDHPLRDEGMWTEDKIEVGDYDELKPLEFWGHSYIPIDATGPGDTRLGEVVAEKVGKYVAIPIPSSDAKIQPATDESCVFDQTTKRKGGA